MYTSLLYPPTPPELQPLYTTYLVLLYINLLHTPTKIITIHIIHKTNISSPHQVYVGQNQTFQHPQDRVGEFWYWIYKTRYHDVLTHSIETTGPPLNI